MPIIAKAAKTIKCILQVLFVASCDLLIARKYKYKKGPMNKQPVIPICLKFIASSATK